MKNKHIDRYANKLGEFFSSAPRERVIEDISKFIDCNKDLKSLSIEKIELYIDEALKNRKDGTECDIKD